MMEIKQETTAEIRCNRCNSHIGYMKIIAYFGTKIDFVKTMQNSSDFYCEMLCDKCKEEIFNNMGRDEDQWKK